MCESSFLDRCLHTVNCVIPCFLQKQTNSLYCMLGICFRSPYTTQNLAKSTVLFWLVHVALNWYQPVGQLLNPCMQIPDGFLRKLQKASQNLWRGMCIPPSRCPGNTSTLASYTLCCYAWYLAFEVTWLPASFHDMELGEN